MDIISGSPVMSINGGSDNAVSSDSEYISLEISGDNSKFTRIILAESLEIPIYQQSSDELMPCLKFLQTIKVRELSQSGYVSDVSKVEFLEVQMHKVPAITDYVAAGIKTATDNGGDEVSSTWRFKAVAWAGWSSAISFSRVLDARP
ncbi:hypothetical protein VCSRO107_3592 [Vibrio cholerae]|nr:hypothetical protein VCSRO107_3592 [Vibrio cholerae]